MMIEKREQKKGIVQDEEVFLYKPYDILFESSKSKTLDLIFIWEEVDNLEKILKTLQSPTKTISFYSPPHYKAI